MNVTCVILLFLHCPFPWTSQGKNGNFILGTNLGCVKIMQVPWQCTQYSKTILNKMYGSLKQIYLQRILPSSFLGNTLISHFSLEESTVMPWNRSSCPLNTPFKAVSSTAVIDMIKFLAASWGMNLDVQL
jgi:hypothetical protein